MIDYNKLEKQLKLEEEMRGLGIMKYRRDVDKARSSGQETTTAYGMSLLSEAIEPTAKKIQELMKAHLKNTLDASAINVRKPKKKPEKRPN
jgi:hypothetical protein